jgi:hypothetical protein
VLPARANRFALWTHHKSPAEMPGFSFTNTTVILSEARGTNLSSGAHA